MSAAMLTVSFAVECASTQSTTAEARSPTTGPPGARKLPGTRGLE